MYIKQIIFLQIVLLLSVSCTNREVHSPKPRAYPRIERADTLVMHEISNFSFLYSSDAKLKGQKVDLKKVIGFNLEYPSFDAVLYCTYIPIEKADLDRVLADNNRLLSSSVIANTSILETEYTNIEQGKSGALFYYDGNPIAPYQFYITDNESYFVRGSLYYNSVVQVDSIATTTSSLRQDVMNLMESFEIKSIK